MRAARGRRDASRPRSSQRRCWTLRPRPQPKARPNWRIARAWAPVRPALAQRPRGDLAGAVPTAIEHVAMQRQRAQRLGSACHRMQWVLRVTVRWQQRERWRRQRRRRWRRWGRAGHAPLSAVTSAPVPNCHTRTVPSSSPLTIRSPSRATHLISDERPQKGRLGTRRTATRPLTEREPNREAWARAAPLHRSPFSACCRT